jgi:hypothetical protein
VKGTLLEAMAAKVPVVVTSVGGVPEVVGPAEAMLVPSEDPRALAEAIRSVIQDPAAATRRAEAAAHRLHTNFGMQRWIDDAIESTTSSCRIECAAALRKGAEPVAVCAVAHLQHNAVDVPHVISSQFRRNACETMSWTHRASARAMLSASFEQGALDGALARHAALQR